MDYFGGRFKEYYCHEIDLHSVFRHELHKYFPGIRVSHNQGAERRWRYNSWYPGSHTVIHNRELQGRKTAKIPQRALQRVSLNQLPGLGSRKVSTNRDYPITSPPLPSSSFEYGRSQTLSELWKIWNSTEARRTNPKSSLMFLFSYYCVKIAFAN